MFPNLTPQSSMDLVQAVKGIDKSTLKSIEERLAELIEAEKADKKRKLALSRQEREFKATVDGIAARESDVVSQKAALEVLEKELATAEAGLTDRKDAFEETKKSKTAEMNKRLRELQASQKAADAIVAKEAELDRRLTAAKDYEARYKARLVELGLMEAA